MKRYGFLALVLSVASCGSTSLVGGDYLGFYELEVDSKTSCHFLAKVEKSPIPTVVCNDSALAWAVPLKEYAGSVWMSAPALTESGTLLAFLGSKNQEQVFVLVSTDLGKNWDINPSFPKKQSEDELLDVSLSKVGRLSAKFKSADDTAYTVEQNATFQSKFTPIKVLAKRYPEHCSKVPVSGTDSKDFKNCLSGYLKRLLK